MARRRPAPGIGGAGQAIGRGLHLELHRRPPDGPPPARNRTARSSATPKANSASISSAEISRFQRSLVNCPVTATAMPSRVP